MTTQIDPDAAGGMRNAHAPTPEVYPPLESMRPTLIGRDYTVSAGHPIVAQIMADVLERGGTAIDAGVAGGLASNVVQVDMCNFGGIAPILLKRAGDATVHAVSGVGVWGREATLARVVERYGGDLPLGFGAGIVPAAPDAWLCALRFGTWSFEGRGTRHRLRLERSSARSSHGHRLRSWTAASPLGKARHPSTGRRGARPERASGSCRPISAGRSNVWPRPSGARTARTGSRPCAPPSTGARSRGPWCASTGTTAAG